MLRELHISNLAIIEQIDIEFSPGLNVFTGQTGAGKSLILGALELLLGLRSGGEDAATFVRPGAAEARVSGVFELTCPALMQRLGEILDQPLKAGEGVLLTRRVSASGRSSVSVNGSPVTAAMLREAGSLLVDIHGQHDQQFLLKPANQLAILDSFAGATPLRQEFAAAFSALRAAQQRLAELTASEARRLELQDLYRFQLDEIDKAAPVAGEYQQARQRYTVLKNASALKSQSAQVLGALSEDDGSVLERLGGLVARIRELQRMDPSLEELAQGLAAAEAMLQDAGRTLGRYQDRLDVDGDELAQVQQRLDVLNHLIHKYARTAAPDADGLAAVLEHRRQVAAKLAELQDDSLAAGKLQGQIDQSAATVAALGTKLTRARTAAAGKLKALVETQFRELEMAEATFDVQVCTRGAEAADASGLDEVDFLIRTNPGQEQLPLRKIASGGEISRIMLALKTILADKDQVSVLVFDEIDANIGDRLGATIGRKMRALAGGQRAGRKGPQAGSHQIICITHLSQIAACAQRHLRISKEVVGAGKQRRTVAAVAVLEGQQRIAELAEMMAGKTPTAATIAHARELLAAAAG
jgi:DNA repair protein RecN (Recombination protein N)